MTAVLGSQQRVLSPTASAFSPSVNRMAVATTHASQEEAAVIQALIRMTLNSQPGNANGHGRIGLPGLQPDNQIRSRSFLIQNVSKSLSHSILSGFFSVSSSFSFICIK
jgi:hypothetical protein